MGSETLIEIQDPHRQKHMAFFRSMESPHFQLTAQEDIRPLLHWAQGRNLPFSPLIVWVLSRAAHDIAEFRWRFRGEQIVEHEWVCPSFTVLTEASTVFSFCTVPFHPDAARFIQEAQRMIEKMQKAPSLEDEEGKDDYLFMSSIPWVSFTGLQHAMHHPGDSIPRIAWGKYYDSHGKTLLPLSVQAHHALIDGRHMGAYFEKVRALAGQPDKLIRI